MRYLHVIVMLCDTTLRSSGSNAQRTVCNLFATAASSITLSKGEGHTQKEREREVER